MLISIKKRLLLFFIAIFFFLGIFFVGFSFKMDESFSKELSKNFINQIRDIDEFGIFFNNLKIALVMFIPVIGIIMGTISGFSTGLVFNSIMDVSGPTSYTNPLIIFFDTIWYFRTSILWIGNIKRWNFVLRTYKKEIHKKVFNIPIGRSRASWYNAFGWCDYRMDDD